MWDADYGGRGHESNSARNKFTFKGSPGMLESREVSVSSRRLLREPADGTVSAASEQPLLISRAPVTSPLDVDTPMHGQICVSWSSDGQGSVCAVHGTSSREAAAEAVWNATQSRLSKPFGDSTA